MLIKQTLLTLAVVASTIFPSFSAATASPSRIKSPVGLVGATQSKGVFDITNYGIAPNSNNDAAPAILKACQDAIAYVKATQQYAEIYIPPGQYFVSQFTISNLQKTKIHLGQNAQIYLYPKNSLKSNFNTAITISQCSDIVIYGEQGSFFDGSGQSWWKKGGNRPDFISLTHCTNYELFGFGINNSPNHNLRLSDCKSGKIHDLSITAPADSPNTDGIDPMSNIDNLEIYNCLISNGDDAFAINSGDGSINNIHIHDCVVQNGHGISIGSGINYDITNVLIENMTVTGSWHAFRIKFGAPDKTIPPAKLKNIMVNNIKASNLTRETIRITTEYDQNSPNTKATLENISISNLTCVGADRALRLELSNPKQAITPLQLNNIWITDVNNADNIIKYPIQQSGQNHF